MKKRIICLALALIMVFVLCACGSDGKYRVVKSLGGQEYSIGFRNGDSTYHYIDRALRELSYEGAVDELFYKWFGDNSTVSFPEKKDALADMGYIEPRTFIIGIDLDSFPLCYVSGVDYEGFDVELAQKVCDKLGWVLKIQPIHSEDAYIELNSGNIDCAWCGVVLDKECPDYTILVTYMSTDLVLAGKSVNGGGIRDKVLYMGTTQYSLDIME